MLLLMKETRQGSEDGFKLNLYHAHQTYDVADEMGARFVQRGWAKRIVTESFEDAVERIKTELRGKQ